MKILTVVFDLDKGGTQRAAQNFCEAYHILGHESKILGTEGGGFRKNELEQENIQAWTGMTEANLLEIAKWGPEVIHLHSVGLLANFVYHLKEVCKEAKFVETNVFSDPSPFSNILDYSYQLSEWCQYSYIARGGDKNKSVIIPNPVKTKNFYKANALECETFKKKHGIPEDVFLFGRIGQHFYDKWSLYLIDVFKDFLQEVSQEVRLVVVNPPKEILKYAEERKVIDKIICIDKIFGDEELRKCYSVMDVFLHIANQGESFGLVLAESLLCETPVLTLNTPWSDNSQSEVVGNGIGGLCSHTVGEFYQNMKDLYHNPKLRIHFGKEGRKHIINKYEFTQVAADSVNLFLENKRKPTIEAASYQRLSRFYNPVTAFILFLKLNLLGSRPSNSLINKLLDRALKIIGNFNSKRNFKFKS